VLLAWRNFFVACDPDIVTGYNTQNFDFPYLIDRAKCLSKKAPKLKRFPFLGRIRNRYVLCGREDVTFLCPVFLCCIYAWCECECDVLQCCCVRVDATLTLTMFFSVQRMHYSESRLTTSTFSSSAFGTRDNKDLSMEGRVQFDLLQLMRREYKLRSYSLNAVSAHFLGRSRECSCDVHSCDLYSAHAISLSTCNVTH
jgi:DNA polymerase elongation subunit (family B)